MQVHTSMISVSVHIRMPIHYTCNYVYTLLAEIWPLRWDLDSLKQETPNFSSNQLCFFPGYHTIKKTSIQSFVGDLVFHLKRFSCFAVGWERHFEHFYFEAQALYISFRRELEQIRPSVSYFETPKLFVVAMLREFTTGKGGVWEPQEGVWPF